jgi:tRNA threonylcarbamoyladenosine biosynthesis protein TsaE
MNYSLTKILPDEKTTLAVGAALATVCKPGMILFLQGDLGAGKTTFTRGFIKGLGYTGKVKSPTYTIVEPYEIYDQKLYHFDFYRLNDPQELEFIGLQDYFGQQAFILIEWPERASQLLPPADLSCYIVPHLNGRQIRLEANTEDGETALKDFIQRYGK